MHSHECYHSKVDNAIRYSELLRVISLDIDAQIDLMTDSASSHHRFYMIPGGDQCYDRPIKVKFQGQRLKECFFSAMYDKLGEISKIINEYGHIWVLFE